MDTPKTDDSEATITLDTETVAVLRAHRTRQRRERLAAGSTRVATGLVFMTETGEQLHPADLTDHFDHLTTQAGLPPIRLHDLRHGAATMGLAAGVDMKVISKRLLHSSPGFTQKFYGAVLPELATAAVVPAADAPQQKPHDGWSHQAVGVRRRVRRTRSPASRPSLALSYGRRRCQAGVVLLVPGALLARWAERVGAVDDHPVRWCCPRLPALGRLCAALAWTGTLVVLAGARADLLRCASNCRCRTTVQGAYPCPANSMRNPSAHEASQGYCVVV